MFVKSIAACLGLLAGGFAPAFGMVAEDQIVGWHTSGRPVLAGDIREGADLSEVAFEPGVDLSGATFTWVNLAGSSLAGVNLRNARFYRGTWHEVVNFSGADLTDARFEKVFIKDLILDRSNLTRTDFRGCHIERFSLEQAVWSGTIWLAGRTDHPLESPASPGAESAGVPSAGSGQDLKFTLAGLGGPGLRILAQPTPGTLPSGHGAGVGAGSAACPEQPAPAVPPSESRKRKAESKDLRDPDSGEPPAKKARREPVEDDAWTAFLEELIMFQKTEGHTDVPRGQYPSLGLWVSSQRSEYRKRKGRLPADHILALEGIPTWHWGKRPNNDLERASITWEAHLEALKAYASAHKTTQIHRGHVEGGLKLGSWVPNQRSFKRRDHPQMTPERITALESVPYWEW